jgi:hypothetical protein
VSAYAPQPAIANVPVPSLAPVVYADSATLVTSLQNYGIVSVSSIPDGLIRAASMAADQEGPFQGVMLDPQQDRQWPRTFKYGWPNIIAASSAILVSVAYPGAWYLDYEAVVPQQIVDWVALKCYQFLTLPFDRQITSESVTGASVKYSPWTGAPNTAPAMLDEIMNSLISPFQLREGHQAIFPNYGSV